MLEHAIYIVLQCSSQISFNLALYIMLSLGALVSKVSSSQDTLLKHTVIQTIDPMNVQQNRIEN